MCTRVRACMTVYMSVAGVFCMWRSHWPGVPYHRAHSIHALLVTSPAEYIKNFHFSAPPPPPPLSLTSPVFFLLNVETLQNLINSKCNRINIKLQKRTYNHKKITLQKLSTVEHFLLLQRDHRKSSQKPSETNKIRLGGWRFSKKLHVRLQMVFCIHIGLRVEA